ncbi:MAG: RDD family protein [Chloroflexi bacterium]|nr:RDD family protein [Chloroflexota bacterium]
MTQTCPQCARDNAPGNRFCIFCAQPLEADVGAQGLAPLPTVACPQCSAANDAANRFCTACGFPLEAFHNDASLYRKVCQGCSALNEASFAYCYRCGLALPQRLLPAAQVGGSPAGFWIRLLAYFIDGIIVWVSFYVVVSLVFGDSFRQIVVLFQAGYGYDSRLLLLSVALPATYYTVSVGTWGRTPGKAILGLKIVRTSGSKVSHLRAFARYLAYAASILPLGLGFLAIALSAQKRGWHDFLCDTRVVRTREQRSDRPGSPS